MRTFCRELTRQASAGCVNSSGVPKLISIRLFKFKWYDRSSSWRLLPCDFARNSSKLCPGVAKVPIYDDISDS